MHMKLEKPHKKNKIKKNQQKMIKGVIHPHKKTSKKAPVVHKPYHETILLEGKLARF